MAERIPLSKLIRASIESTRDPGSSDAALAVSGREAETPRLDSVPIKKFPMFFIVNRIDYPYFTTD
jgi:hypothetical protein